VLLPQCAPSEEEALEKLAPIDWNGEESSLMVIGRRVWKKICTEKML